MLLKRFLLVFCLILSVYRVSCDTSDVNYLKDHFIANLIEETRGMSSAQLTDDIERVINLKIEGFLGVIAAPTMKSRPRRETSNDLLSNEKSE